MFEFKKKQTPIANIAFISMMAAINVVFSILMAFIPYIMFIIVLILPMTSVLVAIYCQKKYYPLYIIATIGLCFISAIWDPSITIFYILPSMITGFCFALFVKFKMPNIYLILIPSLIQVGFNYLGLYISYLLTGVNVIETFRKVLALEEFFLFYVIVPSIILVIAIMQSLFSYMIIKDELPKFGLDLESKNNYFWFNIDVNFVLLTMTLCFGLFKPTMQMAYFCFILSLVISWFICLETCKHKTKVNIILNVVALFLTSLTFAATYSMVHVGAALLIFAIWNVLTSIIAIFNKQLLKRANNATI